MERKINQIGIVVKDIQKAVEFYQAIFNITFQIIERPKETCLLHGLESCFQIKTALGIISGIQIELIQVLEGRTAHVEFIEKHGEGLHHFGIYVDNLEVEISSCAAKGIGLISRGEFMGVKWAYMDTVGVSGAIMEFIELPKPRVKKPKKAVINSS